jgi:hypothetical protein
MGLNDDLKTESNNANVLLAEYYKGMPCMLGEAVGKIVDESEDGFWGEINGVKMYSILLFATPHGTIIKTGVMKLSKITDEGLQKLSEYEKQVIDKGDELYGGRLAQQTCANT